eukprot:4349556-Amphidinium_carterae.1
METSRDSGDAGNALNPALLKRPQQNQRLPVQIGFFPKVVCLTTICILTGFPLNWHCWALQLAGCQSD